MNLFCNVLLQLQTKCCYYFQIISVASTYCPITTCLTSCSSVTHWYLKETINLISADIEFIHLVMIEICINFHTSCRSELDINVNAVCESEFPSVCTPVLLSHYWDWSTVLQVNDHLKKHFLSELNASCHVVVKSFLWRALFLSNGTNWAGR